MMIAISLGAVALAVVFTLSADRASWPSSSEDDVEDE